MAESKTPVGAAEETTQDEKGGKKGKAVRLFALFLLVSVLITFPFSLSPEFSFLEMYAVFWLFMGVGLGPFVALGGLGFGAVKATKLIQDKIKADVPLENDDGQGRLAVVSEGQKPEGQVSFQSEKKRGQVALAKADREKPPN